VQFSNTVENRRLAGFLAAVLFKLLE